MALTFNMVLRDAGIDPAGVRLLRHADPWAQRAIYKAALDRDPRFDHFQSAQWEPKVLSSFRSCQHVAGFVADDAGDTVFAGVWAVMGETGVRYEEPFAGRPAEERPATVFDTGRVEVFDVYRGKLVIDWGAGMRAWVQRADLQDKPIVELRRNIVEPAFPGYLAFQASLGEVGGLPAGWVAALQACCGVYLLVHRATGELYVGSASGEDGFHGRWMSYQDGHGGNVGLRELDGDAADYDVSILETAGSGQDVDAILQLEARWKAKLASRVHGLNRN